MGPAINWLFEEGFARKPIVVVEDHTYHFEEVLRTLHMSSWPNQMTLVCLDRPGPDTTRSVETWLETYPGLQVAARLEPTWLDGLAAVDRCRCLALPADFFSQQHRFCRTVAGLIRPGGLLIQDIQLETLDFINEEAWWETIYLASSVRGMFALTPPACRFMSNKSGFGISFGKELMEAGFDPRDVIDKNDLTLIIAEVLETYMRTAFAYLLEAANGESEPIEERVSAADKELLAQALDLLIWDDGTAAALEGRLLTRRLGKGGSGRPSAQEVATWHELVEAHFAAGPGVPVDQVGGRLAAEGALRAERTNTAARHLHTLRSRLADGNAIVTTSGHYALGRRLRVGRVKPI